MRNALCVFFSDLTTISINLLFHHHVTNAEVKRVEAFPSQETQIV